MYMYLFDTVWKSIPEDVLKYLLHILVLDVVVIIQLGSKVSQLIATAHLKYKMT